MLQFWKYSWMLWCTLLTRVNYFPHVSGIQCQGYCTEGKLDQETYSGAREKYPNCTKDISIDCTGRKACAVYNYKMTKPINTEFTMKGCGDDAPGDMKLQTSLTCGTAADFEKRGTIMGCYCNSEKCNAAAPATAPDKGPGGGGESGGSAAVTTPVGGSSNPTLESGKGSDASCTRPVPGWAIKCYRCRRENCWMLSINEGTHNIHYATEDEKRSCSAQAKLCYKVKIIEPYAVRADPFYRVACLNSASSCDDVVKSESTTFGRIVKCYSCATDYCNNDTLGTPQNPGLPGHAKSSSSALLATDCAVVLVLALTAWILETLLRSRQD